jgi:hypothetical protein
MLKTWAQFNSLYRRHRSTYRRPDWLKHLLSTNLVISQSNADRLNCRLFSVKKTKGYSLGKSQKNERFSQRRRLSQKAHQTTRLDQ